MSGNLVSLGRMVCPTQSNNQTKITDTKGNQSHEDRVKVKSFDKKKKRMFECHKDIVKKKWRKERKKKKNGWFTS